MKIRTGDTVVITTGKDKGKVAKVLRVLAEENRLIVEGVNMRTKHIRKTPQKPGERIRYEASLHASNVMLIDAKTKKRTRVRFEVHPNGGKFRIAVKSGEAVDGKGARVSKKDAPKAPKSSHRKSSREDANMAKKSSSRETASRRDEIDRSSGPSHVQHSSGS
ncbi:50S ribosomal protein L24 [Candidatus Peregrinibacteria bacterium CG22_combo_CG10-13_8_21_14_all_49_11]|nr:MAG: 50S ribosomal protein L24 [Candidatus Peregrinibacteria bacterium CG22_combo_CG10-13_8_21_14_all_49_11]